MSGLSYELIENEFNLMEVHQRKSDKKIANGVEYKNNYQHVIDIREKSFGGIRVQRQQETEKVIEDAQKYKHSECSGCGKNDITVYRDMFDGQCAECTNKSLYDEDFTVRAKSRNEILRQAGK